MLVYKNHGRPLGAFLFFSFSSKKIRHSAQTRAKHARAAPENLEARFGNQYISLTGLGLHAKQPSPHLRTLYQERREGKIFIIWAHPQFSPLRFSCVLSWKIYLYPFLNQTRANTMVDQNDILADKLFVQGGVFAQSTKTEKLKPAYVRQRLPFSLPTRHKHTSQQFHDPTAHDSLTLTIPSRPVTVEPTTAFSEFCHITGYLLLFVLFMAALLSPFLITMYQNRAHSRHHSHQSYRWFGKTTSPEDEENVVRLLPTNPSDDAEEDEDLDDDWIRAPPRPTLAWSIQPRSWIR